MQTITGKVISIKMNQTVIVQVDRQVAHPKYHKQMHRITKYHVHVTVPVQLGDQVKINKIKPMSKTKHWIVAEVVKV
ncbi:MAG: 30S ribosomal protein S17 [bacterium]|nr:30S ribosomal protein S17 [bacterium]